MSQQSLHKYLCEWIFLPQIRHCLGYMASCFRKATLQAREQNLAMRIISRFLINTLPQISQVYVRHLSQSLVCGVGISIKLPHLIQYLGGQVGYGKRCILNNLGCFDQYSLSSLAWHFLHRVIKLRKLLALSVFLNNLKGILWCAIRPLRLPNLPQSWQVKLSRSSIDKEILVQSLPLYIAISFIIA